MFVDEIEEPVISDGPWETADNYSPGTNGIDDLEVSVGTGAEEAGSPLESSK